MAKFLSYFLTTLAFISIALTMAYAFMGNHTTATFYGVYAILLFIIEEKYR